MDLLATTCAEQVRNWTFRQPHLQKELVVDFITVSTTQGHLRTVQNSCEYCSKIQVARPQHKLGKALFTSTMFFVVVVNCQEIVYVE